MNLKQLIVASSDISVVCSYWILDNTVHFPHTCLLFQKENITQITFS